MTVRPSKTLLVIGDRKNEKLNLYTRRFCSKL
jgi:hypothetical protein